MVASIKSPKPNAARIMLCAVLLDTKRCFDCAFRGGLNYPVRADPQYSISSFQTSCFPLLNLLNLLSKKRKMVVSLIEKIARHINKPQRHPSLIIIISRSGAYTETRVANLPFTDVLK